MILFKQLFSFTGFIGLLGSVHRRMVLAKYSRFVHFPHNSR
jgi:hypothetical protein